MTTAGDPKDLVVLVADKNMEFAVRGILSRTASLGMRAISHDLVVHPEKDPGCLRSAHDLLRAQANRYRYALVVLDREGAGGGEATAEIWKAQSEIGSGDPAGVIVPTWS